MTTVINDMECGWSEYPGCERALDFAHDFTARTGRPTIVETYHLMGVVYAGSCIRVRAAYGPGWFWRHFWFWEEVEFFDFMVEDDFLEDE